ncbi:MAG: hypothetical protein E7017_06580 [Alphaproteobacteria bacterium]|nr:hypothetical protein [Alphaproteobacteria bacterium]
MNNSRICELVCTRISHDIVGNIGAVANAVELLEEDDLDFMDDIKSILKTSSQTLTARMKFFRLAFGLGNTGLTNNDVVFKTTQDYLHTLGNKDYPITLKMSVCENNQRSAMLMVMAIADILIRGGEISVFEQNNRLICSIDSSLKISSDKLEKIYNAVNGMSEPNDAAMAPVCFLSEQNDNIKISLVQTADFIQLVME